MLHQGWNDTVANFLRLGPEKKFAIFVYVMICEFKIWLLKFKSKKHIIERGKNS